MTQIIDIESKKVYEVNPSHEGENNLVCPKCSPSRRKKNEKCLQWNQGKGVGQCYHCGTAFVLYRPLRERPSKSYAIPIWKNKTDLTDEAVKWFEGRMISQATLREMRIYSDKEWMPQFGTEAKVICFPYFVGDKLVNIKYRGPQKSFRMVKDAELVFYNYDCIAGARELIIVEGEIDALSFIEAGFKNVVSVPNGAGARDLSYLDSCIDDLSHIETFYIATDQDEPGIGLRNELIRRLGEERCKVVYFGGHKDANEMLCAGDGCMFHEVLQKANYLPLRGVQDLDGVYDNILTLFRNGLDTGKTVGIESIDKLITWKTGQVVVWTGIPSHGKSEMLNFMVVRWNLMWGWKSIFFSPENMPYHIYLFPKLASVLVGKTFRSGFMTDDEFNRSFDYIADNFKFIDAGDDYSVETVIETARNAVKRYGIKVLVIDPFNCFEHRRERNESETEYIGRFLDTLVRFARKYDVLVNLVAHPRKMDKLNACSYNRPTLYDINGSANFYNKADIGITVYRRFNDHPNGPGTELVVSKVRFKEQGETGVVDLQYNLQNGRYAVPVPDIHLLDNSDWLQLRQQSDFPNDETWTPGSDLPF